MPSLIVIPGKAYVARQTEQAAKAINDFGLATVDAFSVVGEAGRYRRKLRQAIQARYRIVWRGGRATRRYWYWEHEVERLIMIMDERGYSRRNLGIKTPRL